MRWLQLVWFRFVEILKRIFLPQGALPPGMQKWPRRPPKKEPDTCPRCSGRIERDGSDYVCRGITTEAEVRRAWDGRVPQGFTSLDPCGWRAPADEFGITWV